MIASERMARGVACPPDFMKELSHLPRQDPLILQPSKQLVLWFLRRREQTDPGGKELSQYLGKLAQF